MSRTMGIDLGTSNSAAALMKDGKIILAPASEGPTSYGKMFPSVVAFKEDGEVVVGQNAKNYAYEHPERTVRWIKRKMGTDFTVNIDDHAYSPQEISALIIQKMKRDAEAFVGGNIDKTVISAPAYFDNNQRNATKEAGEMAGLEVLRIISEPTAASLAYGLNQTQKNLKIAVLDLGAGTFDVTILQMNDNVFQVISTSGDTMLGGKDMDDAILDYLVNEIEEKHGVNLEADTRDLNRLRDAGETAKILLSSQPSTIIETPLHIGFSKLNTKIVLTQKKLQELIKPQLDKLRAPVQQALRDSGLSSQDIDKLVLVGGPTRMPIVKEYFGSFFDVEPEVGIDPMGIVATGASVQASVLNGEMRGMLLLDVTPLSLGVETAGGVFTRLIKRNTTIPVEENMIFATEEDWQTSMMIHVLQGEREMAKNNISVGLFKLDDIPAAPKYEQKIEVSFKIDANGILTVSAEILETGKTKAIKVAEAKNLSTEDITRMIIEATKFSETDEREKEAVETRNRAMAMIHAAQRLIEVSSGKISGKEKASLEDTTAQLKAALDGYNPQKVKECTSALRELTEGVNRKLKKVCQAKTLVSSVEKKFGDKMSVEEKKRIRVAVKNLEEASYKEVNAEIMKLKDMAALLEADYGEG